MIVFVKTNGDVQSVLPSPVYQGSSLYDGLYFVAPFPSTNGVTVSFTLADGNVTESYALTPDPVKLPDVINGLGEEYSVWGWQNSNADITRFPGSVTAQFSVVFSGEVLTTAAVNFTVQEGVTPTQPETPSADQWATLAELYSRVAAKTMVNFTVDPETGLATKYYSNGDTETVQLPTKNSATPQQATTNGFTVLNFTTNSWSEVADTDPKKYFIAWSAASTGQATGNFIVELETSGSETYKPDTVSGNPTEHTGHTTLNDSVFKGSDGSLYIESTTLYDGRVLIFSDVLWNNYTFTGTASVDDNSGTPSVDVTVSDGDTAKPKFNFSFKNLKGQKGEKGDKGDKGDNGVSVVAVELIKQ